MESQTKNRASFEQILAMAQDAFGKDIVLRKQDVTELEDGCYNAVYRLNLPEDRSVILKIAPPPDVEIMSYEHNIMKSEIEMLQVALENSIIPLPRVLFYDDSCRHVNSPYYFMKCMPGENFFKIKGTLSRQDSDIIEIQMGAYNRQLNQIKGDYFGLVGEPRMRGANWRDTFNVIFEAALSDGERKNTDLPYAAMRNVMTEYAAALNEVTEPFFVHWDLWDGNVMVENKKISGIIDFERALWGDPLLEVSFQPIVFEPGKITPFMQGYGQTHFTRNERLRRLLYDLYLCAIMVVECGYRQYTDDTQYKQTQERLRWLMQIAEEMR